MSCMVRSHCECWYELLLLSPLMPTLHSLARIQYRNNFTTAVQLWCCCCMLGANQMTAATSALCRRGSPPWNLVNGQQLRMCYIVWISPQSHNLLSVKLHYLRHALQWPWPVRKRFSRDHCCAEGGQNLKTSDNSENTSHTHTDTHTRRWSSEGEFIRQRRQRLSVDGSWCVARQKILTVCCWQFANHTLRRKLALQCATYSCTQWPNYDMIYRYCMVPVIGFDVPLDIL